VAADRPIINIQGPFAHSVDLPGSADVSTIKFEKVRKIKVRATINYGFDPAKCQELVTGELWRAPGCAYKTIKTTVAAFEMIYSYTGEPLASDEYASRTFTFGVYFRPEDLPEHLQTVLSGRKLSRSEAAAYFDVNIQRNSVTEDPVLSRPCNGNFSEGPGILTNARCRGSVSSAVVTTASDEVTVVVKLRPFALPSVETARGSHSKR